MPFFGCQSPFRRLSDPGILAQIGAPPSQFKAASGFSAHMICEEYAVAAMALAGLICRTAHRRPPALLVRRASGNSSV
jgi:hypothetical protein